MPFDQVQVIQQCGFVVYRIIIHICWKMAAGVIICWGIHGISGRQKESDNNIIE
jgi:hypothetical protein